jgi:hypothetical protein
MTDALMGCPAIAERGIFGAPLVRRTEESIRRMMAAVGLIVSVLGLLALPAVSEMPVSVVTIRDIQVDPVGNTSYSLALDLILIIAEKQGGPCNGFDRDDQVDATVDGKTLVLTKGASTCRLIIRSAE